MATSPNSQLTNAEIRSRLLQFFPAEQIGPVNDLTRTQYLRKLDSTLASGTSSSSVSSESTSRHSNQETADKIADLPAPQLPQLARLEETSRRNSKTRSPAKAVQFDASQNRSVSSTRSERIERRASPVRSPSTPPRAAARALDAPVATPTASGTSSVQLLASSRHAAPPVPSTPVSSVSLSSSASDTSSSYLLSTPDYSRMQLTRRPIHDLNLIPMPVRTHTEHTAFTNYRFSRSSGLSSTRRSWYKSRGCQRLAAALLLLVIVALALLALYHLKILPIAA